MIMIDFQCNGCFTRHRKYVPDAGNCAALYTPDDWIIEDNHVPICPDCKRDKVTPYVP